MYCTVHVYVFIFTLYVNQYHTVVILNAIISLLCPKFANLKFLMKPSLNH